MLDWNKGQNEQHVSRTDYIRDMESAMNEICEMLKEESKKFSAKDFYGKVYGYIEKNERLLYTSMTNCIFTLSDEQFGIIQTNIDNVVSYMHSEEYSKDFPEASELTNKRRLHERSQRTILKIWDHINLARRQYILFSHKDDDYAKIVDEKMQTVEAKMTKEMNVQLISLIAIFTALSFLIFGGISSLDNIFLGAKDIPVTKLMIVGTIWCFCIMNLIFVFLFFVSKLTGLNIKSTQDVNANLIQKYPMIWWCNWVLISVLALSCWSYYVTCENFSVDLYNFLMKYSTVYFVLGTLTVISAVGYSAKKLYKLFMKKGK